MTGKQRTLAAIRGAPHDRVPVAQHNFTFCARQAGLTMTEFRGSPKRAAQALADARLAQPFQKQYKQALGEGLISLHLTCRTPDDEQSHVRAVPGGTGRLCSERTSRRLGSLALFVFCVRWFLATATAADLFPGFADQHTVALWLFDEPQYFQATLTDASLNRQDLRLLDGGRLAPGKFGHALGFSSKRGPAAASACEAWGFDGPRDARPIEAPTVLRSTLAKADWTLEFWLRLEAMPGADATLLELGAGLSPALNCGLADLGRSMTLGGSMLDHGLIFPCRINLSDNQWHHVAFVREGRRFQLYLDGRPQPDPKAAPQQPAVPAASWMPGLIGARYARHDFHEPFHFDVATQIDFYWSEVREAKWAERWRGGLRAPASETVDFFVEAYDGAKLVIDDQPVIDTLLKQENGYGQYTLVQDRIHPLQFEFCQSARSSRLRLLWRRPGHDWETIPPEALWHTANEETAALAEAGSTCRQPLRLMIGCGWPYRQPLDGELDELRVSDTVRYREEFRPPGSFSRNYGTHPSKPAAATGPPLLFDPANQGPLRLGSRRHVFIDDAIIEARQFVHLKINPPKKRGVVHFKGDRPWEILPGRPPSIAGDVYDNDGKEIRMMYMNGAMWGGPKPHTISLATSTDGLHFIRPKLGVVKWEGSSDNNIVLDAPCQGRFFIDTNPNVAAAERYKFSSFSMGRGVYLWLSPDGIHWRRNESAMFPFDVGGGVETFWDDQRGVYVSFMRHEGWVHGINCADPDGYRSGRFPFGRAAAMGQTREPLKPWPFEPQPEPALSYRTWALPTLSEELPVPFAPYAEWQPDPGTRDSLGMPGRFMRQGQVYRTRATKYPWAPDTYVAFVWRMFDLRPNEHRATELATSRNGIDWHFHREPFYYPAGGEIEPGVKMIEALAMDGLIRRGNELWQYVLARNATHYESSANDRLILFTQRLDGFTALEAGEQPGWIITRPFIFAGSRLRLNVAADGEVRIGILDERANAIPGFTLHECDPVRADSVEQLATWEGNPDVGKLAGRVVRLRFDLKRAKLFAFQFDPAGKAD